MRPCSTPSTCPRSPAGAVHEAQARSRAPGRGHRHERRRRPRPEWVVPQRAARRSRGELRLGTHRPTSFPGAAHHGRTSTSATQAARRHTRMTSCPIHVQGARERFARLGRRECCACVVGRNSRPVLIVIANGTWKDENVLGMSTSTERLATPSKRVSTGARFSWCRPEHTARLTLCSAAHADRPTGTT